VVFVRQDLDCAGDADSPSDDLPVAAVLA